MSTNEPTADMANEIVVAGAVFMALLSTSKANVWPDPNQPNSLLVSFPFMRSRYRVTVSSTGEEAEPC